MAGGGIAGRLYRGELSVNIVHRQRRWYAISGRNDGSNSSTSREA